MAQSQNRYIGFRFFASRSIIQDKRFSRPVSVLHHSMPACRSFDRETLLGNLYKLPHVSLISLLRYRFVPPKSLETEPHPIDRFLGLFYFSSTIISH